MGFTVAHQYLHQLDPDIRHAVLGKCRDSHFVSRGRGGCAPYLKKEFNDSVDRADSPARKLRVDIKTMIDGMPLNVFSAATLRPSEA